MGSLSGSNFLCLYDSSFDVSVNKTRNLRNSVKIACRYENVLLRVHFRCFGFKSACTEKIHQDTLLVVFVGKSKCFDRFEQVEIPLASQSLLVFLSCHKHIGTGFAVSITKPSPAATLTIIRKASPSYFRAFISISKQENLPLRHLE